jgi:hypothetical protein
MVLWRCCSKREGYDDVERATDGSTEDQNQPQDLVSSTADETAPPQTKEPYHPDDLNAVRSWRERHVSADTSDAPDLPASDTAVDSEEAPSVAPENNDIDRIDVEENDETALQLKEQHMQRQQHLLQLHLQEQQQRLLEGNDQESSGSDKVGQDLDHHPVNDVGGGFPTFTKEEEEWRRNQLLNKEAYLSSSSSSSVEDPILLRRFLPLHQAGSPGPVDLDDFDDEELCSSSLSRPGTDDGESQPLGPRQFSHVKVLDVQTLRALQILRSCPRKNHLNFLD